jgi:hypothetical protein
MNLVAEAGTVEVWTKLSKYRELKELEDEFRCAFYVHSFICPQLPIQIEDLLAGRHVHHEDKQVG